MAAIVTLTDGLIAGLLLASAAGKFRDLAGFTASLETYGFPPHLRRWLRQGIPLLEALIGAALLIGVYRLVATMGAAILLGSFTAALLWAKVGGRSISCGCMGQAEVAPVSLVALARNVFFVTLALVGASIDVIPPIPMVIPIALTSSVANGLIAVFLDSRVLVERYA